MLNTRPTMSRPLRPDFTDVPAQRRRNMAAVRGANTKPELIVRRLLHGQGYRYRLQRRDLPGRPDIVFLGRKAVIDIRGCFWHCHPDPACRFATNPSGLVGRETGRHSARGDELIWITLDVTDGYRI